MKTVAIITTGSEIMHGDVLDSNSNYIARALFASELVVKYVLSSGDNDDHLTDIVHFALRNCDIIIITGGLGATDDDRTLEVLRNIFGFTVTVDKQALERLRSLAGSYHATSIEKDLKMAEVPDGALIIENKYGYAPGFILNDRIIALPGVPNEMTWMFDNAVLPFLYKTFGVGLRPHYRVRVVGLKESEINSKLNESHATLAAVEWGITARHGIKTVTFVPKKKSQVVDATILAVVNKLFGEYLLPEQCVSSEHALVNLLISKGLTIATAESCTGGLIAKRLTDIPGASQVFKGSVVAYANSVKQELLLVSQATLDTYGAVSEATAVAMAKGAQKLLHADAALATTGIAGPDGGTAAKPVGTVCVALAYRDREESFTELFCGSREDIRAQTALAAIEYARKLLK